MNVDWYYTDPEEVRRDSNDTENGDNLERSHYPMSCDISAGGYFVWENVMSLEGAVSLRE